MKIYFLLSLIPYLIYILFKSKKTIQMLQQNYYDEGNRYLNWINKNKSKVFLKKELIVIITYFVISFLGNECINLSLFAILTFVLLLTYIYKNRHTQAKIKLVITKRVKRLYITYIFINILIILLVYFNYNPSHLYIYNIVFFVLTYLEYYFLLLVNIVNKPIEKLVYKYYENKAKKKLRDMNNINVIGVTGSYGKTSTKNIIATILNVKYTTFATPKNFNTTYGLINTINNYLDKFTKYFVTEMGAFQVGDIKKSCDLVYPKYGVLTSIGKAHLESFGSQKNIQNTKFELIESLPNDGFGILNADDPLQVSYKLKNKVNIYWISMKDKNADLYATNVKLDDNGTNFDCIFKGDKKMYHFNTCLLGNYNIYNLLDGILIGYKLGMSPDTLIIGVSQVKPVEHRLELKQVCGINYIDDAYNSNPNGSKMALDVLDMMRGYKVIVTPGMVELGIDEYELNKKFGEQIASVCDIVILVGKEQTKAIYEGLIDKKYSKEKIFVVDDIKEAFAQVRNISTNKDKYVLLENDLPDIFNEV